MVYFECLKRLIPVEEQNRILTFEGLIPLFYEVALNIVKQKIRRYRPMWMVKEYIKRAHPTIFNKDLFKDVGDILTHIINDENRTHIRDISFILEDFLGLRKKILLTAKIPDTNFKAIDYWMNNIFDGNLSTYNNTKHLLDKIFDFYEKLDVTIDSNSKREIIFKKYKQFYDDKLNSIYIDINNIQSVESHKYFIKEMVKITQKYCMNKEIKDKLIYSLKTKYEELHRYALNVTKNLPLIKGSNYIPNEEIENALKPFENDTLQEFLQKIVISDYFIPDIPNLSSDDLGITRYFPTKVYDDNSSRYFKSGEPVVETNFYYKLKVMKNLVYLEYKLKEYEIHEFLGNVYAIIHSSELIDELTKKMFQISLEHYGRGDYFHNIQTIIFQIERILRDLSEKNGILNLFEDENRTVPKGLEHLLGQLSEKDVLSKKILYFIGWLLSGSCEIITENIRNKIAHGVDNLEQFKIVYNKKNALAIILIYLSLSKCKKSSSSSSN